MTINPQALVAALLAACLPAAPAAAQAPESAPPSAAASAPASVPLVLAPYELRGDNIVHDPSLWISGEGVHHVFGTGPYLQRLQSADGVTWKRTPPVFSAATVPGWWKEAVPGHKGRDVWAPKIFQHGGRFHVMYSISTFGSRVSAIGSASASAPDAADWRDDGLVVRSNDNDNFNAIDPDVLVADDGRVWLTYGSFWGGIRQSELDPKTLKPSGPTRFVAQKRDGIEAPTLMQRGGQYFLFVSWGFCCRGADSTYNIRVGRSASPNGPFIDRDGVDLMDGGGTLVEEGGPRWRGPGHQDVFGDRLVRHSYDAQSGGRPRLRLSVIKWSPEGWPQP